MRTPSVNRMCATFRDLTRADARLIKAIGKARDDADSLRALIDSKVPATAAYARQCYSDPYDSRMWRTTMALHAIDQILGTHGVECIGRCSDDGRQPAPIEYCNTGDAYAATLLYRHTTDTLSIGCWDDAMEAYERRHGRLE